ncbi:MAG: type III-B CRISPR module RAMP protein Cmr6 [Gammaproteobacteria bacterium]
MAMPLYGDCCPTKERDSHAGLWFDRFFNKYDNNWQVPKDESGKLAWIKTVTGTVGDAAIAEHANRQRQLVKCLDGQTIVAKTDWHFVSGMGINHPVENGFAWHPTLGVPYLTGAAIKGLLRAWCEQWAGFDAIKLRLWFGPSLDELDAKTANPAAGKLIFFDALPIGPVQLKADVMTPHYGKWYEEGDKPPEQEGSNVPADWHNPVPVPFLVVAPGQAFQFSVATRPGSGIVVDDVVKELKSALASLGAGAKTAAGYGRMEEDEKLTRNLHDEAEKLVREKAGASKTENQRNIDRLREAFATQRSLNRKAPAGSTLFQQLIGLLVTTDQDTWTASEKNELAKLVAAEYPDTLQLGKREKDVKKTLRILRGEELT